MSNRLLTQAEYFEVMWKIWDECLAEVDMQMAIEIWEGEGGR